MVDVITRWNMVRGHMWAFLRALLGATVTTEGARRACHVEQLVADAVSNQLAHSERGVGVLLTPGRLPMAKTLKYSMAVQTALIKFVQSEMEFAAGAILRQANVTTDVEPMEVVPWLYRQLQLLRLLSPTAPVRMHTSRGPFVRLCLRLVLSGPPKVMQLALQLVRDAAPSLPPGVVDEAVARLFQEFHGADAPAPYDSPVPRLVHGMLGMVAMGYCDLKFGSQPPYGHVLSAWRKVVLMPKSAQMYTFSQPTGLGRGAILAALATECVAILRRLLGSPTWRPVMEHALIHTLTQAAEVTWKPSGMTGQNMEPLQRALAVLIVLGGRREAPREGGLARVHGSKSNAVVSRYQPGDDVVELQYPSGATAQPVISTIGSVSDIPVAEGTFSGEMSSKFAALIHSFLHYSVENANDCTPEELLASRLQSVRGVLSHRVAVLLRT